jgi:hypothetical protein
MEEEEKEEEEEDRKVNTCNSKIYPSIGLHAFQ